MMQFTFKKISGAMLLSSVALAAIAMPGAASAQTTPAADTADGDIIVTARKRSEDIQTVPISITAYTAKDLTDRNISNLSDLTNTTPGVSITSSAGGNVLLIYLRGLAPANTANDLNVEANVGVFIDGIYQTSRNTLDIISVLDVGQIEIAKGPQSALFGRSTFAGALAISTGRPSHELGGSVSATVGIDKDYRVKGNISLPLSDTLFLRVAGGGVSYDGYGFNSANPGNNLGGTKKYAGSASLEFTPTDNFTARLSGFYAHSSTEMTPVRLLPATSFNCGNVSGGLSLLYCGTLQAQKISSISPNLPDTVTESRQISLDLNWRKDGVSVTSTTGFTAAENRAFNDYDGSAAGVTLGVCGLGSSCVFSPTYTRLANVNLVSSSAERVRTFSQEIRLQSDNNSPFSWLLGGSYFSSRVPLSAVGIGTDVGSLAANERYLAVPQIGVVPTAGTGAYEFTANAFLVPNSLTSQLFGSYTVASTKTFGIFGALGYKFGNLRLNAEGRYNIDRKQAQNFAIVNPLSTPYLYQPINGTSTPAAGVFPPAATGLLAKTFQSFAPRFTADLQVTPEIFLFASAAKGVRSGGFNASPVSSTGILASEVAYGEESNWTYEGGFKTNLFDRMLLLNASVFHTDWTNAQVTSFTANPTATTPTRIVTNAGNLKTTGFEVQADLKIAKMFGFGGSLTYSDPKFQAGAYDGSQIAQCRVGTTPATYTSAPGCPAIIAVPTANGGTQYVPTLEGKRPTRSVKWQWNLHATAEIPLSEEWKATGRVDVSHSGSTYNNLINTVMFGARTLTNARIGIESSRFSVAVWGNNLFDVTYVQNAINQPRAGFPFALSVPEVYLGEGRRYGVTVGAKF